jgi:BlaI family penicillinase repressor
MPHRPSPHPTEAELEILSVLWEQGPSTVRQVHEILQADRETALTTTLKMLQVMTEKGKTKRIGKSRPQLYGAVKPRCQTQSGLLNELAQRAFGGSMQKLLLRAVEASNISSDELASIRKIVNDASDEQKGDKP